MEHRYRPLAVRRGHVRGQPAGARWRRWSRIAMLALLGACSGDDPGEMPEGGECQLCRSKMPYCDSGMTCERFQSNVTFYSLCAKPTTTSCPVPFAAGDGLAERR